MRNWKRRLSLALILAQCLVLLAGCGGEDADIALSVCAGGDLEDLDPIYATSQGDQTVLAHLYENLMRLTVDVSGGSTATAGMAKSVDQEENHDGTVTYTFRLRGTKWSDGKSVTAGDFVYAWQRLADPANDSPYAGLLSVVAGYETVRSTGDVTALQVSAKNDAILEVVLSGKYDWFLSEVCTATATLPVRQSALEAWQAAADQADQTAMEQGTEAPTPEPWWSDVTALVTNGPYTASAYAAGESLTLTAAETYSGTQSGPGELTFRFAATPEEAQALYDAKTVDFVWRQTDEQLAQRAQEESWTPTTELGVYTLLLNNRQDQLADPQVRGALTSVIDRAALAQAAGVTARAAEGLVPAGVAGEDGDFRAAGAVLGVEAEDYAAACQVGRDLLDQAGGAPEGLEYLYAAGAANEAVAQALCGQWSRELGVAVTPRAVTAAELTAALRTGNYTLAGTTFQPAGNDAECYLMPWITGGEGNLVGYANSAYDTLMSIIASAEDGAARMGCLHDAEVLLLGDYALSPLYTTVTAWTLRDDLTGVCRDARGWFSFTGVAVRTA